MDSKLYILSYKALPTTVPECRTTKVGWLEKHKKHQLLCLEKNTKFILIGDSIINGLSFYPDIWAKYFEPLQMLNLGIGGDQTQHVLWRVEDLIIPNTTKVVVVHCGTNNLHKHDHHCIAYGLLCIAVKLQEKIAGLKVIVTGLLPRGLHESPTREKISTVNAILKDLCRTRFNNVHYMEQDRDWVLPDGILDESLYFADHLHLVKKGDKKLAISILSAISQLDHVFKDDIKTAMPKELTERFIDPEELRPNPTVVDRFKFCSVS